MAWEREVQVVYYGICEECFRKSSRVVLDESGKAEDAEDELHRRGWSWVGGVARCTLCTEEREAQRRSFVYGNTKIDNDNITHAMVDKAAERLLKEGETNAT